MSDWIHINDQKPEEDRDLFYFFAFLGIYRGKYQRYEYPVEFTGETEEPVYGDTFYSERGFLTDDVTHWMYADGFLVGSDEKPDVPDGYIQVYEGKFREYCLKEETVLITKREYEGLKYQNEYLEAGHLNGLVCQDGCPCHIYWYEADEDDAEGYKCGGCGKVYPTEDVETNPENYKESTYNHGD